MLKPKDWETTPVYGEYVPLELGGHVCRIMKVETAKSRTNKPMIVIYLDIEEGQQKGYFAERYRMNTKQDKKWDNAATVYQLTCTEEGNTNPRFKTFTDAVKNSNTDFIEEKLWSDNDADFCDYLKGRLIGAVFGREEYLNANNEKKLATKVFRFCTITDVHKGIEVPQDKLLDETKQLPAVSGFSAADINEDDLPF